MESPNVPVWRAETQWNFPPLDGEWRGDACVIGLGGSGLACVFELMNAGRQVVAIDAATVASGAAGRNGGFLLGGLAMFHHDARARLGAEVARRIYEETLIEIERIATETPFAVRRTGSLRIAASAEELADCEQQLAVMREDGLPAESYDGPEGRGIVFPRDAAFDPAARCMALAAHAVMNGALLFEQSPALEIVPGGVRTPKGIVRAADIIVAVDGRLESIFPQLASRVRSARLQMLATEPTEEITLERPVYSRWGLDYWQQRADRRIVLGGCRDVGGDEEWTSVAEPSQRVQDSLTTLLRERLGVQAPVSHRWAATVGYTQSGLPILDEVRPRVWAVGGYSGTGNVVGAMCGRAAAQLAINGRSEIAELLRA
jgi:glycine/D-amino acid oxidase-like deaminating enzyme